MPDPTPKDNPLLTFAKGHAQAGLVDCAAASADAALREWVAKGHYVEHSDAFLAGHASRDAEVAALKSEINRLYMANVDTTISSTPSAEVESLRKERDDEKERRQDLETTLDDARTDCDTVAAKLAEAKDWRNEAEGKLIQCGKEIGNLAEIIEARDGSLTAARTLADDLAEALEGQPCECLDEYNIHLPEPCDRCTLLARHLAQKEAR